MTFRDLLRMTATPNEPDDSLRLFEVYMSFEGRKPRLPQRFCWPVGVELLSKRFSHIPQSNLIKIWFNDHPSDNYCLTMEKIANQLLPHRILTVWHSVMKHKVSWFFMVYPVESMSRSGIRSILHEAAFDAIDKWLCADRTPVWHSSSHHLDCIFDPNEKTLKVVERERI